MKAPRYTFLVTIEQNRPEEERNFGSADGWASIIKYHLENRFEFSGVATLIEVKLTRTRNRKAGK